MHPYDRKQIYLFRDGFVWKYGLYTGMYADREDYVILTTGIPARTHHNDVILIMEVENPGAFVDYFDSYAGFLAG